MILNWMYVVFFLFLMLLNQSIISRDFCHRLYLELLSILDVILCIKSLESKPSSVLVGLISLPCFLSWKFCLWSLNKMKTHFSFSFPNLSLICSLIANLTVSLLISAGVLIWSILLYFVILLRICSYSYGLSWNIFLHLSALIQNFSEFPHLFNISFHLHPESIFSISQTNFPFF